MPGASGRVPRCVSVLSRLSLACFADVQVVSDGGLPSLGEVACVSGPGSVLQYVRLAGG